jgi:hypothetical protein
LEARLEQLYTIIVLRVGQYAVAPSKRETGPQHSCSPMASSAQRRATACQSPVDVCRCLSQTLVDERIMTRDDAPGPPLSQPASRARETLSVFCHALPWSNRPRPACGDSRLGTLLHRPIPRLLSDGNMPFCAFMLPLGQTRGQYQTSHMRNREHLQNLLRTETCAPCPLHGQLSIVPSSINLRANSAAIYSAGSVRCTCMPNIAADAAS